MEDVLLKLNSHKNEPRMIVNRQKSVAHRMSFGNATDRNIGRGVSELVRRVRKEILRLSMGRRTKILLLIRQVADGERRSGSRSSRFSVLEDPSSSWERIERSCLITNRSKAVYIYK